MSRWKHRTDKVTVGENSQNVRALTNKERTAFAQASQQIKAGQLAPTELPGMVAKFGCVDPVLTPEEVDDMPGDLLDACVGRIMQLTGLKEEQEPGEKKDS